MAKTKLSSDQKAMLVILLDGPLRYEEARTTFSSLKRKGLAELRTEAAPANKVLPYNRMMYLTDEGRTAANGCKTLAVMEHVDLIRMAMKRRSESQQ